MSNLHFKCLTTDQVPIAGTKCKCNFSLFRPVCISSVDIHGRLCLCAISHDIKKKKDTDGVSVYFVHLIILRLENTIC